VHAIYVSKNNSKINRVKTQLKSIIRDAICSKIDDVYFLYLISNENLPEIIDKNFSILNGKIFRANDMREEEALLSLSKAETFSDENSKVLTILAESDVRLQTIGFS
jgi:hypothetical protein